MFNKAHISEIKQVITMLISVLLYLKKKYNNNLYNILL